MLHLSNQSHYEEDRPVVTFFGPNHYWKSSFEYYTKTCLCYKIFLFNKIFQTKNRNNNTCLTLENKGLTTTTTKSISKNTNEANRKFVLDSFSGVSTTSKKHKHKTAHYSTYTDWTAELLRTLLIYSRGGVTVFLTWPFESLAFCWNLSKRFANFGVE